MEKVKIISEAISLVEMMPEERIALVKALINEWQLKQEDCFVGEPKHRGRKPKVVSETNEVKEPKRRGRKPKVVSETDEVKEPKRRGRKPKAVSDTDEVKEPERRGRKPKIVSETDEVKEPKRRGRKPKIDNTTKLLKVSIENVDSGSTPKRRRGRPKKMVEHKDGFTGNLTASDASLVEEVRNCPDVRRVLDDDEVYVAVPEIKKRNQAFVYFANYPVLKKQVIGQEQEFELLYKWKGKLLLSRYILTEMMPMGIYVRYKTRVFGKYIGFIVYLYDETVIRDVGDAVVDAKKWELVDNECWSVMDSLQWGVLKPILEKVNRLLSKVGGDMMRGHYKTISPGSSFSSGIGNIRYTLNVK